MSDFGEFLKQTDKSTLREYGQQAGDAGRLVIAGHLNQDPETIEAGMLRLGKTLNLPQKDIENIVVRLIQDL